MVIYETGGFIITVYHRNYGDRIPYKTKAWAKPN